MSSQLILMSVTVLAVLVGVEGAVAHATLRRRVAKARRDAPTDPRSGLLDGRAFVPRVAGELNRARRYDGNVWCVVWRAGGQADEIAGALAALPFPAVPFRLGEHEFCVVRTNAGPDMRSRLRAFVEQWHEPVGEATFPADADNAEELLRVARARAGRA